VYLRNKSKGHSIESLSWVTIEQKIFATPSLILIDERLKFEADGERCLAGLMSDGVWYGFEA
jgi:hypothetical protein